MTNKDNPEPMYIQKGVYRHNKTGNLYEVIGVALHSETSEQLVMYKPLHRSRYEFFVRPHGMFTELVEINGKQGPRFELVNEGKHDEE